MATINHASKVASFIDEKFKESSRISRAFSGNHKVEWRGVESVDVFTWNTSPMRNYNKANGGGLRRYGDPKDITNKKRNYPITRDRAFTYILDKRDYVQTNMAWSAGKSLQAQMDDEVVPEIDRYGFWKLASKAGTKNATAISSDKGAAYGAFLAAQSALDNANAPESGRVCFAVDTFINKLKLDFGGFMAYGDKAQELMIRGGLGMIDGVNIIRVNSSLLPSGMNFLLTHPIAATMPKQIENFNIHDDPPGVSGWLVEGRLLYEVIVFAEKRGAIYYSGTAPAATFPEKVYYEYVLTTDTSITEGKQYYTEEDGIFEETTPEVGSNPKTLGLYEQTTAS